MAKEKLGYVASLDGLRGIAIILVLLTHANFQLGQNGIIGVHVFFALSGFLITTLILEEKSLAGSFSFPNFYLRRIFRLAPALIALLIVVFVYSILLPANETRNSIWQEILGSLFYLYNIMWIWDWGNESSLLAHSWSLAVEEQFYLIWPVLLIGLSSLLEKKLNMILLFFTLILSIISKEYFWKNGVYQSLIHESIFFGCLAGLLRYNFPRFKVNIYLSALIIVAIFIAGVFPSKFVNSAFTGNFAGLVGLISSIAIVGLVANPRSTFGKLLSNSFLVFIGKISYSLYLWHVPIFKWFKQYSGFEPWISFLLKFVVTFLISYSSFTLIENVYRARINNLRNLYLGTKKVQS